MPIYEYVCMSCESHFEELVRHDESPECPDCGADEGAAAVLGVRSSRQQPVECRCRRARRTAVRRLWARKLWLRRQLTHPTRSLTLAGYGDLVAGCTQCALAAGRTQVVFGSGSPTADLMFVGEAPGFHEDKQGVPFVGAAGQLLGKLLAGIGLGRDDVYVANVLKCRPPGNRDPQPEEIEACEGHLFRQIELIRPKVVATLGNFSTKLLSGKPLGITRVHGQEQEVTLGGSRCCSTRSSTRPPRSTPRGCSTCSKPTSAGSPSCSAERPRRPQAAADVEPAPEVAEPEPIQLGLF